MTKPNAYALTFRGQPVRFMEMRNKVSWTSVYDEQFVVLTYRMVGGKSDLVPSVSYAYKTLATTRLALRDYGALTRYPGQSFIVRVTPGTTEVTEAEVFENVKPKAVRA